MTNPHNMPLPQKFLKMVENVRRLDDKGQLYLLDYSENCYELEKYVDMLVGAGCSTFVTFNKENEAIMGRNYDFSHYRFNDKKNIDALSGLAIVVKNSNPSVRYKSIGVCDGFWMDQKNGSYFEGVLDDGKTDISPLIFSPFLCMDGVNEKGLAVSIMQLDKKNYWEEVDYIDPDSMSEKEKEKVIFLEKGEEPRIKEFKATEGSYWINKEDHKTWLNHKEPSCNQKEDGKKSVYHTVLMRLMLDNCATVEEAIALCKSVNVKSAYEGSDYHIMVADRSGKSVIIEWTNNVTAVGEAKHSTNYELLSDDQFGHGQERDAILVAALEYYKRGMSFETIRNTLQLASQNRLLDSKIGYTQWSSIYNLNKATLSLFIRLNYEKEYTFEV